MVMDQSAGQPLLVDCVEGWVCRLPWSASNWRGVGGTPQTAVLGSPAVCMAASSLGVCYSTNVCMFFLPKIAGGEQKIHME